MKTYKVTYWHKNQSKVSLIVKANHMEAALEQTKQGCVTPDVYSWLVEVNY